jgi:hypothetical protein
MAGKTKSHFGEIRRWAIMARSILFLKCSRAFVSFEAMNDTLTPADPSDLADAIAFALIFRGKKRVHDSDRFMAKIAGDRIVRHLENAGYVVMKKPPIGGAGHNPGQTGIPGR